MKKFLLSLATVAMATSFAMADEVSFDFKTKAYGLPNDAATFVAENASAKDGAVTLTFGGGDTWRYWSDGLRAYAKSKNPVVTISATDAKITKVSFQTKSAFISGYKIDNATAFTDITANKTFDIACDGQSVKLTFKGTNNAAVEKMTVYYEATLTGDQKPSGLSFAQTAFTIADGDAFTAPTLVNPNNLPVVWTSSNEAVATVANGVVTVKGIGTTIIAAASKETAEFAAGKASYTLTVEGAAKSVAELIAMCPAKNDKALVNFPLTVVYKNDRSCYVVDAKGDATLLFNNNPYNVGDVIPAGWTATYSPFNGLPEFTMSATPAATSTAAVEYAKVNTVSDADVNKVVILTGVTFEEATLGTKDNFDGELSDGSTLAFRNNFIIASVPAGKYDVKVAVALFNGALQVYPIEYTEVADEPVVPTPGDVVVTGGPFDFTYSATATGTAVWDPGTSTVETGYKVKLTTSEPSVEFTITTVPAGYDLVFYSEESANEGLSRKARRVMADPMLYSFDEAKGFLAQFNMYPVQGNKFTVPADGEIHSFGIMFGMMEDGKVMIDANPDNVVRMEIVVESTSTGVDAIEAAEGEAVYYNLQGVRVANPEKGIYVKVLNGKSTKVVF